MQRSCWRAVQGKHGDLHVRYTVLFPKVVSEQQKQQLRDMFKEEAWQPAAHDEL